ncbi:complement factor H-related protein 2-like [Perca flavescens]|uniref:complement factor H-related protein 2-like n=1 Tax=Perca flavescens TaxID=8167 RepID=UPI00106DE08A|nr:complement factor H-related protein 2-like [Perca flavescens]
MRLFHLLWLFILLLNSESSLQQNEVVCSNQRPQNVYSLEYNWWQQKKMGETTRYWCKIGYMSTDGATRATCTREGWTPNPLCREIVGCGSPPPLTDGDIKYTVKTNYSHQERVEFMCQNYYTMEGGPNTTCINGEWIGQMKCLKPCIVDRELMNRYNIAFRYTNSDELYFAHNDFIEFTCTKGRHTGTLSMRQKCIDGVLNLPTCQ